MSKKRGSRQKERKTTRREAIENDRKRFRPSLRGKDSIDTKLNILIGLLLGTMIISAFFVTGGLANDPFGFAGGWEIQGSMSKVAFEGENDWKTLITTGLHQTSYDTDGDFQAAVNAKGSYVDIVPKNYDDPDVIVKVGYPYYLEQIQSGWIESDDPYIVDVYPRDFNKTNADGSTTMVHVEYTEYAVGMSVQIQTAAEKYYKPQFIPFVQEGYLDYGYYYEDNVADIEVRANVALSPWIPSGVYEGWSITGGWAGIMSISVYEVEYGLADAGATENKGHVIQGLMSEGQAVNMYPVGSSVPEENTDLSDFTDAVDPTAIVDVPDSVDFEVVASLGAGADYETDLLSHWTDVAVRNVFVTYHMKASFVSTLVYELAVGNEGEIEPPPENNTAYAPEITPLGDFLEYMESLYPGFQNMMIIVVAGIFGILFIVIIIKIGRR